jgi:hypothetical protein
MLLQHRHAEAMLLVLRDAKEQVQSRRGIQMHIYLQVIASLHLDGSGRFGFCGVVVVGGRVSDVKSRRDLLCGTARYVWLRHRMHRVPRLRADGDVILSRTQQGQLVKTAIVARGLIESRDTRHPRAMVLHKESHARFSHRIAKFIKYMAGDERQGRKTKNQILGGKFRAGHNGRGELLMLFVGRGNESPFRSLQGILSRLHLRKLKVPIFRSDYRNQFGALFRFCDGDAGLGKRLAGNRVYHRSRNSKRLAPLATFMRRRILILPGSRTAQQQRRQPGNDNQYPANS